jgi:uncharacterized protein YkwD
MKSRLIGRKLKRVIVLTLAIVILLSVLMPAASASGWRATPSSNPFTDVHPHHWHHNYVSWAWANGITTGTSPTTFEPYSYVTRAQFATFIHRVAGTPSASPSAFADSGTIPSWAANAVGWASSSGITTGFLGDNTYRPGSNITREQIATMLYRYAQNTGLDTSVLTNFLDAFPDSGEVSGWATTAMQWAVYHRIITGINDNLAPQSNATRTQTVAMLYRLVNTFGISAANLPSAPPTTTTPSHELLLHELHNSMRADHGLGSLSWNAQLAAAAKAHSDDMFANDFMSHYGSDGSSPWERAVAHGYSFSFVGENIAWGYTSAEAVFDAWMRSPPHRANILLADYTEIGIGITGTLWTVKFGRPGW